MVLQDQMGRLDREALLVFLVREGSVGCRGFRDLGVPQENKDPQEHLEIKAPQAQLVLLALKDLVVILVLMALQDQMAHQAKMVF